MGEFRALALSAFISLLGDAALYAALTVIVYSRTSSSLQAALVLAVAFLPYLFGGAFLSALVDRIPHRQLLIVCDFVAATTVAVLLVPSLPVGGYFVVLFLVSLLAPVRAGASGALVAHMLPPSAFVPGRSVLRISAQLAQLFGVCVGGALVAVVTASGAIAADIGSFLLSSIVVLLGVKSRPASRSPSRQRPLLRDSVQGAGALLQMKAVRQALAVGWVFNFVGIAPEGLGAAAVTEAGAPSQWVALWLAAIPLGIIVGDLAVVYLIPARYRVAAVWPLTLSLSATYCCFVLPLPLALRIVLLVVAGMTFSYGLGLDQLQKNVTPPDCLARMYSLNSSGMMLAQALGLTVSGLLSEYMPTSASIACVGLAGVGACLVYALSAWRYARQTNS